jgi:hypothetical protein
MFPCYPLFLCNLKTWAAKLAISSPQCPTGFKLSYLSGGEKVWSDLIMPPMLLFYSAPGMKFGRRERRSLFLMSFGAALALLLWYFTLFTNLEQWNFLERSCTFLDTFAPKLPGKSITLWGKWIRLTGIYGGFAPAIIKRPERKCLLAIITRLCLWENIWAML